MCFWFKLKPLKMDVVFIDIPKGLSLYGRCFNFKCCDLPFHEFRCRGSAFSLVLWLLKCRDADLVEPCAHQGDGTCRLLQRGKVTRL